MARDRQRISGSSARRLVSTTFIVETNGPSLIDVELRKQRHRNAVLMVPKFVAMSYDFQGPDSRQVLCSSAFSKLMSCLIRELYLE